jgi:hypothetical protein
MRYTALAAHAGHAEAARRGDAASRWWQLRSNILGRHELPPDAVEAIFQLRRQERLVAEWSAMNRIRRVVIADFAKNLYATYRACRMAGLEIDAITDANPAFAGRQYRGVPIVAPDRLTSPIDGIVLANINPAQAPQRLTELRTEFDQPILSLAPIDTPPFIRRAA